MKNIIFIFILISLNSYAGLSTDFYKKVFPQLTKIEDIRINDPISDEPVNTILKVVFQGARKIGFIREISTTTGCNSACLPVVYTSFYDSTGKFKSLISRDGLTKINHTPFSPEDYSQLEFLILGTNSQFDSIKHPKEMTDAISGATIKKFEGKVVKGAAYTTLRVYLYNKQTKTEIKKYLMK